MTRPWAPQFTDSLGARTDCCTLSDTPVAGRSGEGFQRPSCRPREGTFTGTPTMAALHARMQARIEDRPSAVRRHRQPFDRLRNHGFPSQ